MSAERWEGLIEKAPYPCCQLNFPKFGDWVFNHLEEADLRVSTSFAVVRVRGSWIAK